jgi:hypothetical protein
MKPPEDRLCYLQTFYRKNEIHVDDSYDEIGDSEHERGVGPGLEQNKVEEEKKNKDPQQSLPKNKPGPVPNIPGRHNEENSQKNNKQAKHVDHNQVIHIFRHGERGSTESQEPSQAVRGANEGFQGKGTHNRRIGNNVKDSRPENPQPEMLCFWGSFHNRLLSAFSVLGHARGRALGKPLDYQRLVAWITVSFRRKAVTGKSLIALEKISPGIYPVLDPEAEIEGRHLKGSK